MAKAKKNAIEKAGLSDEAIAAAFFKTGAITGVAQELGVTPTVILTRFRENPDLMALLDDVDIAWHDQALAFLHKAFRDPDTDTALKIKLAQYFVGRGEKKIQ